MHITLADILKLNTFKEARILSKDTDLNRMVSFNYVIDSFCDFKETLNGLADDVLVFVFGHSIANEPERLIEILGMLENFKIPGVIVYVNKYIKEIPKTVIHAYQDAKMPLITIPWQVKYLDVANEIFSAITRKQLEVQEQSDLLAQLLFDPTFDGPDITFRLSQLNYNHDTPHCILVAKINSFNLCSPPTRFRDFNTGELKENYHTALRNYFSLNDFEFISMQHGDSIIFLMEKEDCKKIGDDSGQLLGIHPASNNCEISLDIGIGMNVNKLDELQVSYNQAKNVIDAKRRKLVEPHINYFGDLGLFQILYTVDLTHLKKLYPNKIKPIIEYDQTHNSCLLDTLEIYLDNKNSLATAAKILFVHKNTILYRIDKVNSLVNINNYDIFNLLFEIKIYKYLQS